MFCSTAFSLQPGSTEGSGNMSDPAGLSSLFLRITGTCFLDDESLSALGIGSTVVPSFSPSAPSNPEYWFRVPAKCAQGLQLFFTHWNPEMAGIHASDDKPGTSIKRSKALGFRPPDNLHRTTDSDEGLKEWEVISIEESIKRNQAEDAEIRRSLPLPEMQVGPKAFFC